MIPIESTDKKSGLRLLMFSVVLAGGQLSTAYGPIMGLGFRSPALYCLSLLISCVGLLGLWAGRGTFSSGGDGKIGYALCWASVQLPGPVVFFIGPLWPVTLWQYFFTLLLWVAFWAAWVERPAQSFWRALLTALVGTLLTTPTNLDFLLGSIPWAPVEPLVLAVPRLLLNSLQGNGISLAYFYTWAQLVIALTAFLIAFLPSKAIKEAM